VVSLLYYDERQQLVAITSSGSAILMAKGSSTDRPTVTAEDSDAWSVLLRMKVSNTAAGCGLQVSSSRAHCAFKAYGRRV